MKKLFALFWLLLLATSFAKAQTTVVSATVLDPNSGPYARGTWLVTFVPNPNSAVPPTLNGAPFTKQFSGTTDTAGAFTVTLADNTIVNPQGSQWIFQICSFGSTCFQYQTSVSGTTLNLSSALSAHSTPIMGNTLLNARGFQGTDNGLKVVGAQGQSACLMDFFDAQGNLLLCLSNNGTLTCISGCGGSGGNTVGPGTVNTFAYFDTATTVKTGPLSFDPVGLETFSTNSLSQPTSDYPCINSASGTTTSLLVTTDSNGNCINIADGQAINIVGVAHYGAGTSGTVQVAQIGEVPIIYDNQTIIGDCAIPAATGARAHDSGSQTCPGGPQQIGRVTSLNSGTGTAAKTRVFISDVTSIPSGPSFVIQVTGTTLLGTTANFNNTTPAAQANFLNCQFQTDNATPISDVSLECPQATASQNGFVRLAGDLNGGSAASPTVTGVQTIPVTFTSTAARDVVCFPTSSTLGNCQLGVPVRTVAGNSDAILTTDRVTNVRYTAASGATPVTIAQAGSAGFLFNFTTLLTNAQVTGIVTVTPTVSTINGNATLAIPAGIYCFLYSDNSNYTANCGSITGGGGTVTGTGTTNTLTKWVSATAIGNSSLTDDGTTPTRATQGINSTQFGNYDEWIIDTAGVTANKLACRSSNNRAITCPTNTKQGVLGVALSTGTTGQTVIVCWAAHCTVIPSNNTITGHWLIPSMTVAGDVDDTGSTTQPTGTQSFLAESSVTAPAQVATTILSPDSVGANTPAPIRGLVFSYGDPGGTSAITAGSTATDYFTVPFACTIQAYTLSADAGTATVKFWKIATGTAIPTVANSINTSGVALSTGTSVHSTTLSDFTTTTIAANDNMAMNVSTSATAKFITATLQCQ